MFGMRTRKIGLTAALMLVGSLGVACGGQGNEGTATNEEPTTNNATENVAEQPTNDSGDEQGAEPNLPAATEPTAEELGEAAVEGQEGQDDGFAATLAENPADPEAAPADGGGEATAEGEGVGQLSDALLSTRGATLASEARRIANFTNRSTSYYYYQTYMNESTGTRRADCSGLLAYIISRKSPSGYSLIPRWEGSSRPLARDYFNYLKNRPTSASTTTSARWRRITKPSALKPGDIVVYAYSSGQTTGHAMMVKETPWKGSRSGEWIVPVVDSARSGHASDTRGSTYSGPGAGRLGIKVNSYGYPTGYYWKGGVSTYLNQTTIVMGRLE